MDVGGFDFGEGFEEIGDDGGEGGFVFGGPDTRLEVGGIGNGDGDVFHAILLRWGRNFLTCAVSDSVRLA
jgi:hypothetical protein